ncbi:MAG: hypothetical protein Kow006_13370 [Gammaproteobacteria bacterium]
MHCMACAVRRHANVIPVALTLIEHDGRLVMIQRTKGPLEGYWAPPAGHVEIGEPIAHAAIREAREESGLNIELRSLAGVYTQPAGSSGDSRMVISAYYGRSVDGVPVAGDDAGDIRLYRAGELPFQPPPNCGTSLEYWVYGVIQKLTAPWRRSPRDHLRLLSQHKEHNP